MKVDEILPTDSTLLSDNKNPDVDPGLNDAPADNVDQDGNCITPAYGESVGPNTGAPCDDGRSG